MMMMRGSTTPKTEYDLYPAYDTHTACYQSIETQLRGQPGIHLNKQAAFIVTNPSTHDHGIAYWWKHIC